MLFRSGGKFKTLGFMTADDNNTKFWFGTSMANSNVGLYVDDEGYLIVGGPVITEFGDKFQAKATNATKWNSYLKYSSAATNGLYYTNAEMAIKHIEALCDYGLRKYPEGHNEEVDKILNEVRPYLNICKKTGVVRDTLEVLEEYLSK